MAIICLSKDFFDNQGEKIVFLFSQFDTIKDISDRPCYDWQYYNGHRENKHYLVEGLGVPEGDKQIHIVFSQIDNRKYTARNYFEGSIHGMIAFWEEV